MITICIISARGGSQGLPGKNIRLLNGKPLIAWSIEQAKETPEIDRVAVSTDSEEIAEVARSYGADVPFIRPRELAGPCTGKFDVWKHALEACEDYYEKEVSLYVDLDCTNPLRDVFDISRSIALFRERHKDGVDAVFSVCEARKNPYFNLVEPCEQGVMKMSKTLGAAITRRQDAPRVFEHVASIYVLDPEYIRTCSHLLEGTAIGYDIGQDKSLDADSAFDFELIEFLMRKRGRIVV